MSKHPYLAVVPNGFIRGNIFELGQQDLDKPEIIVVNGKQYQVQRQLLAQLREMRAAQRGLLPTHAAFVLIFLGVYAVVVRYCTMPLEKVAMIANSSLVSSGKNQLGQAWRIATKEGLLAPYRTVGPASITAWFLQYSVIFLESLTTNP